MMNKPPFENPEFSPRLRLLGINEVCRAMGECKSTIYDKMHLGLFPKPIKIGKRVKWRESTLIAFLDRLEKRAQDGR